ncbi:unnamed protein product [Hapterophycus canaliculatus]
MQKFVITGGLGLLGRRILRHVLSTGAEDQHNGNAAAAGAAVSVVRGDLACSAVAAAIKSFATDDGNGSASSSSSSPSSPLSVFHLASVMSGQGEADFDEAIRVNIDGACNT